MKEGIKITNKTGTVFDIQSFSVHDGPGIRTIVFLKGCPLKCWWCSNPEGQDALPEVGYHVDKCQHCMSCVIACKNKAIEEITELTSNEDYIKINKEKCRKCLTFDCVDACPNKGLVTWGNLKTVEDVMKYINRDISYFRKNGGVTLSGGEPLYQHEFALEILKACKEEYINTAIETTLYAPFEVIEPFIPFVDLFLCDIKQMDNSKHKEYTGVSNKIILSNICSLAQKSKNILIRIPLIPGCNDDILNIKDTSKFAYDNGISRINILPYHNLGQSKYDKLGKEYKLKDTKSPEADKLEQLKKVVEEQGIKCIIG
ncbi:glycyl-radical enzyme activating protein [Clostridium drakei]|uniref:Glycyl-radical enzyme activating protein n=1 Tax=Clostridium drakei TaxID=332101 RepID=A0A2U8DRN8_9CLOT|nr:glycyl-radical enzyme activating protein [Clostridium drakei]